MAVKPLILIIDDVLENVEVLGETLASTYEIQFAESGEEGLALLCATRPDLILLDVMMPEMSGYEVFSRIKSDPLMESIPVIFVTAKSDAQSESEALNAGAVDFIHKPINPEVVRARVRLQLELMQHRHHLERLVDQRTHELAEARDRAEAANRAKSAFLANMSHELRTPLHQAIGFASLLPRFIQEASGRQRLSMLQQSLDSLQGMIDDLLDIARVESDQMQLTQQDFPLNDVLDALASKIRPLAEAKGLALRVVVDPEVPGMLQGDPDCLGKVLDHLLDNAVKFSEHGEIGLGVSLLSASAGAVLLRFEVRDQGIGISPELEAGLFQLFHQGDNSMTRRFGGTGVGLVLCRRLVTLMGGELGYTSRPGEGSTFWFTLRLLRV